MLKPHASKMILIPKHRLISKLVCHLNEHECTHFVSQSTLAHLMTESEPYSSSWYWNRLTQIIGHHGARNQ